MTLRLGRVVVIRDRGPSLLRVHTFGSYNAATTSRSGVILNGVDAVPPDRRRRFDGAKSDLALARCAADRGRPPSKWGAGHPISEMFAKNETEIPLSVRAETKTVLNAIRAVDLIRVGPSLRLPTGVALPPTTGLSWGAAHTNVEYVQRRPINLLRAPHRLGRYPFRDQSGHLHLANACSSLGTSAAFTEARPVLLVGGSGSQELRATSPRRSVREECQPHHQVAGAGLSKGATCT
jgi:hypothetical protein